MTTRNHKITNRPGPKQETMVNPGALLADRGEVEKAERWCRRAADAGTTDAMSNLGALLRERDDDQQDER
ncbi:hypothetical protein [Micromonospora echinospora]|uniref:hypothetical protein n=1 Tax=Micromonospora echinospora TaxID=1877 RepID=UPI003A86CC52